MYGLVLPCSVQAVHKLWSLKHLVFYESKINVGMYDTWVKHLRDYSRLIQTRLLWENGCRYGISFWAQNEEAAKSERMDSVYSKLSLFIYKLNKAFLGLSSCFLHCGLSPPQYWLYLAPIKGLKGYKTIIVPKVFFSSSKTAVFDEGWVEHIIVRIPLASTIPTTSVIIIFTISSPPPQPPQPSQPPQPPLQT